MPQKKIDPEEALYVNVKKPLELRRNILEASKDVLYTLQKLERIKQLRKEKNELIKTLKVQIGEINILTTKLAEHLPEMTFSTKKREELKKAFRKRIKASLPKPKKHSAKKKDISSTSQKTAKKHAKTKKSVSEQLAKVQGKLKTL